MQRFAQHRCKGICYKCRVRGHEVRMEQCLCKYPCGHQCQSCCSDARKSHQHILCTVCNESWKNSQSPFNSSSEYLKKAERRLNEVRSRYVESLRHKWKWEKCSCEECNLVDETNRPQKYWDMPACPFYRGSSWGCQIAFSLYTVSLKSFIRIWSIKLTYFNER